MEKNVVDALADCEFEYLNLSCVMFCRGDALGKVMALASLLPHVEFLCLISASVFAPRNVQTPIWKVVILLVIGDRLNAILKNLIAQQRPISDLIVYGKYGMPSAHAQFQSALAVSTISLMLCNRKTSNVRSEFVLALSGALFLSILVVGISRVYHPYHTFQQVALGSILGLFLGMNVHNSLLERLTDGTIYLLDAIKKSCVFN